MLPTVSQPPASVRVGDTDVPARGLTLAEVRQIQAVEDAEEADALAICLATGESIEAARAWVSTPGNAGATLELLQGLFKMSGLGEGAQFRG